MHIFEHGIKMGQGLPAGRQVLLRGFIIMTGPFYCKEILREALRANFLDYKKTYVIISKL